MTFCPLLSLSNLNDNIDFEAKFLTIYTLSTFASGLVPPIHNIIERFPNLRVVIAADIKDILLKNRNIKT